MIENNLVTKIVKAIRSGKKSPLSDRSIMHPEREWFSSVLLGSVLLVVGVYWSYSVYVQFSSVNLEAVPNESEGVVYRDNLVEAAVFEINRRAQTYDSLKGSTVIVAPLPEAIEEETVPNEEDIPTVTSSATDVDDLEITFE